MALFSKTDPAVRQQRDLESRLKEKITSRDSLIERRKAAEASATSHREKARQLAANSADDAALLPAESAMRREQDRAATLGDAITDIEATIADLEQGIAQIVDQRCRAETAAAVAALADRWVTIGAAFDAAVRQLVELARESAAITLDAHPLKVFVQAVREQVPPEAALIASVLRDHAAAVLAGHAPASLPLPQAEPAPLKAVEPPPLQTLFCLRTIKWTDANGKKHIVQQYEDAQLAPHLAARAIRRGACVQLDDPRRKNLLGAHGGKHPRADALDTVDLDEQATRSPHDPIMASDPVLASANFRELDRSAEPRGRSESQHRG
jgi:hypothetical protein